MTCSAFSPRQNAFRNGAELVRRWLADTRAATAVEFALVSGILITTIVTIMMVGMFLYIGQALDHVADVAARQIMIGAVQKQGLSQSAFISSVICPAIPLGLTCANVIVNVQTVPEAAQPAGYYAFTNNNQTALLVKSLSNATATFKPGNQGDYVYLQIIYPFTSLPTFMAATFGATATYNGQPAYLSISTAAFRNEQY